MIGRVAVVFFFGTMVVYACSAGKDRRALPASAAGNMVCGHIETSLKVNTTHLYYDRELGIMIIPLLMLPDNRIFLNEEELVATEVGNRVDRISKTFSPSDRQTYRVHLRVHPDTRMRIVGQVKEELIRVGAMRILYSKEDGNLKND